MASLSLTDDPSLTDDQRRRLVDDGYVVIPGVVERPRIDEALRAINHWLGEGIDSSKLAQYRAQSYAPDWGSDPLLLGLLNDTAALPLLSNLLGAPVRRAEHAQVALRFPTPPGTPPGSPSGHIDGIPTPTNGVPFDGRLHGFTALAGVMLADLPGPDMGNLVLWPGSHRLVADYLARHGTDLPDPDVFMRAIRDLAAQAGDPVAVTGEAGDLVIVNYFTIHTSGPHVGPGIRYMLYYRIWHPDGDRQMSFERGAWSAWDGLNQQLD